MLFGMTVGAAALHGQDLTSVVTERLFVPVGFDDNDEIEVVLDGYLPDGCYQISGSKVAIDHNARVIRVQAQARREQKICKAKFMVPFTDVVKIGVLPVGEYKVLVEDSSLEDKLVVTKPLIEGESDDFYYAPVEDVTVRFPKDGGKPIATLSGRFTNTWMQWKGAKVIRTGDTIQILPIMQVVPIAAYEDRERGFSEDVRLPRLIEGRYLIHVRSLNGKAVNKVISVFDEGDPI